jgi:hypothetical protein
MKDKPKKNKKIIKANITFEELMKKALNTPLAKDYKENKPKRKKKRENKSK